MRDKEDGGKQLTRLVPAVPAAALLQSEVGSRRIDFLKVDTERCSTPTEKVQIAYRAPYVRVAPPGRCTVTTTPPFSGAVGG